MVILDRIALALVIIGALNWGSIGLFAFDAVAWIGGGQLAIFISIVYTPDARKGYQRINDTAENRQLSAADPGNGVKGE